jgi:2,3-bisphosphoglycerate-dependent phosphoglycerate mutase
MKNATHTSQFFKLLPILLLLSNFSALAQKTTIWVVRHAEKEASVPGAPYTDPNLSQDGEERAIALAKVLKREDIKTIFITQTKRSDQTAKPLAVQAHILPRVYTDSIKPFAKALLNNFKGTKVLVVGHSNTVMPLLNALGADMPLTKLSEEDFDMIFKVTIKDSGKANLEVYYYGTLHHTSNLPKRYRPDKQNHQQYSRPIRND